MVLFIFDSCINCDMCEFECFNVVISMGNKVYEIDLLCCIECVGYYDVFICVVVCFIDVVKFDLNNRELLDELVEKFVCLNS